MFDDLLISYRSVGLFSCFQFNFLRSVSDMILDLPNDDKAFLFLFLKIVRLTLPVLVHLCLALSIYLLLIK